SGCLFGEAPEEVRDRQPKRLTTVPIDERGWRKDASEARYRELARLPSIRWKAIDMKILKTRQSPRKRSIAYRVLSPVLLFLIPSCGFISPGAAQSTPHTEYHNPILW